MKFSPSLLKAFMGCSLQYKFKKEGHPDLQNAAASFGTAVHQALELYNNTQDLDAALYNFRYTWDNPEEFGITPQFYFPRTNYGYYRERGVEFIKNYAESYQWVDRDILATEHRFCVDIGNHQLSGIVDILETEKGSKQLKVVDLKTGQRPNTKKLNFDVQFTAYMWAAQQRQFWCGYEPEIDKYPGFDDGEAMYEKYKDYTVVGVWYDLRKADEYPVGPREPGDYQKLYRCLDMIAHAVEQEAYVPDISGDTCGICSYADICPLYVIPDVTIPTKDQDATV